MSANMRRRGRKDASPAGVTASADSNSDTADAAAAAETDPESKSSHTRKTGWSPNASDNTRTHPASHGSAKGKKRRHTLVFFLGSLFGLVAAGLFAKSNDLIDFPEIGDLTMDSFFDVLPAGLVTDVRDLVNGERDLLDSYDAFSVGLKVKAEGLNVNHSVIMIPGVISTGLESWGTANASRQYFRKRLWGSWSMMRALVLDKENWKRHIMLDEETGLDPPGYRVRAAQGFDATDFFITGYWIWNKIFENLASLGYDPTNSFTAAYDWRLSYANLETRDQYFTRLKMYIEMAVITSDRKVVLVSHSMGSQVLFYFFHWVASPLGGRGGDGWVEKHVDSWINVSGCMLGAVKDLTAILSGEMRDTAQLNSFAVYGLEKFLSREERADIFRAMPGISSMLPIGGDAVWGTIKDGAPDDLPGQEQSFATLLNFRKDGNYTIAAQNLTVDGALEYLLGTSGEWYRKQIQSSYSRGVAKTMAEVRENEQDPRKWINPLETRLPLAPSLKIFCFYGVGKPTERSYYYRPPEYPASTKLNITIDTTLTHGDAIDHGVVMGEGDGTVNLLSTGYMCNQGWKFRRFNPAGVRVTVVEMPHEPERFNPRGGPNTADHVDILGRQMLNELILRVAAGHGEAIEERVVSNIRQYAAKVKVYEE
ncbi:phospholipid:diacylglycerol acyltransferase [Sporothrix epigloea]|uniref:Phospholipid:diacylglycerol acyltransferase n=1 Tax=Sporothrix epigloea TaxID=1892477 RepID=A0ABP0E2J2_9PEZI